MGTGGLRLVYRNGRTRAHRRVDVRRRLLRSGIYCGDKLVNALRIDTPIEIDYYLCTAASCRMCCGSCWWGRRGFERRHQSEERQLKISRSGKDSTSYMILAPQNQATNNIQVFVLKQYLQEKLKIQFSSR